MKRRFGLKHPVFWVAVLLAAALGFLIPGLIVNALTVRTVSLATTHEKPEAPSLPSVVLPSLIQANADKMDFSFLATLDENSVIGKDRILRASGDYFSYTITMADLFGNVISSFSEERNQLFGADEISALTLTNDGGFLFARCSYSAPIAALASSSLQPAVTPSCTIYKIDYQGKMEWTRTFTGYTSSCFAAGLEVMGYYYLCGCGRPEPGSEEDADAATDEDDLFIFELDRDGSLVRQFRLYGSKNELLGSVQEYGGLFSVQVYSESSDHDYLMQGHWRVTVHPLSIERTFVANNPAIFYGQNIGRFAFNDETTLYLYPGDPNYETLCKKVKGTPVAVLDHEESLMVVSRRSEWQRSTFGNQNPLESVMHPVQVYLDTTYFTEFQKSVDAFPGAMLWSTDDGGRERFVYGEYLYGYQPIALDGSNVKEQKESY